MTDVYVLLNQDFHLAIAREILGADADHVHWIWIPHRRSADSRTRTSGSLDIPSPLTRKLGWARLDLLLRARLAVNRWAAQVKPDSTLLFFTEYELLNQCLVRAFRAAGGHAFLVEENGVMPYACNKLADQALPIWRAYPKWLAAQWVWGLPRARAVSSDGMAYPIGDDAELDGLVYFHPVSSVRKSRHFLLQHCRPSASPAAPASGVLYVNQDIYNFFMPRAEYEDFLVTAIERLRRRYAKVWFKFHPRERGTEIEAALRARLQGRCEFLEDPRPLEEAIVTLGVVDVCSFMSSGLMGLSRKGYRVEFLFREWAGYRGSPLLRALANAIDEMNALTMSVDAKEQQRLEHWQELTRCGGA